MAVADPTMELIRSLDDPAKWIVTSVVAFVPHERDFPEKVLTDGTKVPAKKIKVTEADLRVEADKANQRMRTTGRLDPLTIGHRKFDPGFPETEQPPLVGFCRNYSVQWIEREQGRFLGVVYEECAARDKAEEFSLYRQYPFRSVDYHPVLGFSGVAALIRPPALDMGTTYLYQANVKEPTVDDDENKAYASFCKFMRKYEADKAEEEKKKTTTYQHPSPPPPPAVPSAPAPAEAAATAQYAADLAELRKKLADETAARVTAECRALLDPLKPLIRFTYERELDVLTKCADVTARAAHVKYMAETYMPLPGGEMIRTYQGDPPAPGANNDPTKDQPRRQEIVSYMRSHPGCSYEHAEAHVLAQK